MRSFVFHHQYAYNVQKLKYGNLWSDRETSILVKTFAFLYKVDLFFYPILITLSNLHCDNSNLRASLICVVHYGSFPTRMALINISDAFFNLMRCRSYFLVLYVYVGVGRSSERLESAKKVLARDADKDHRGEQGLGHQEVERTRVQLSPGGNKKVP